MSKQWRKGRMRFSSKVGWGRREDETVVNGGGPRSLWKRYQCSFCERVVVTWVFTSWLFIGTYICGILFSMNTIFHNIPKFPNKTKRQGLPYSGDSRMSSPEFKAESFKDRTEHKFGIREQSAHTKPSAVIWRLSLPLRQQKASSPWLWPNCCR